MKKEIFRWAMFAYAVFMTAAVVMIAVGLNHCVQSQNRIEHKIDMLYNDYEEYD